MRLKRGFTLVEMLIAMSIFVIFITVLMSSYTSLIRAQREANNYRQLYAEARSIFDTLSQEVRDKAIVFDQYSGGAFGDTKITLIAKDYSGGTRIELDGEKIKLIKLDQFSNESLSDSYDLNSDRVRVNDLRFFVSPSSDPYRYENVTVDHLQFQPKVTVYAVFAIDSLSSGKEYLMPLQTSISSRIYNQSPDFFEEVI